MNFPVPHSWKEACELQSVCSDGLQFAEDRAKTLLQSYDQELLAAYKKHTGKTTKDTSKAWESLLPEVRSPIRDRMLKRYNALFTPLLDAKAFYTKERKRLADEALLSPSSERTTWLLYHFSYDAFRSCDSGAGTYNKIYCELLVTDFSLRGVQTKHELIEPGYTGRNVFVFVRDENDVELLSDLPTQRSTREVIRQILKLGGNPAVIFPGLPIWDLEKRWRLNWQGNDIPQKTVTL